MSRPFAPLSAAVVLLAAGAGGFLSYRLSVQPRPTITPAGAHVSAEPEPPSLVAMAPQRLVPDVLPEVVMPDLSGKTRRLSEWQGHLLAVNFWAAWCEPCQREIPLLKKVRAEHAADGFEVVGIAVDLRAAVAKYAQQAQIDYPVLVGERGGLAAIKALGMDMVFPFTVFADRKGRIITLKQGELHPDEAKLILDRMTDLDAGRLSLEDARARISDGMAALAAARASH